MGYSFHGIVWEGKRDKRCGRSEPLWPGETKGCHHSGDFVTDSAVNLEEEEEVDDGTNDDRNHREDDMEDWTLFDFDSVSPDSRYL